MIMKTMMADAQSTYCVSGTVPSAFHILTQLIL